MSLIYIGQFPPPVNGLSYITERLAAALAQSGRNLDIVDVAARSRTRSPLFHAARFVKTLGALRTLVVNRLAAGACYLTAEGGLGLAYSVMIASVARLRGYRLFIHHHSFNYIVAWRPLMALLMLAAGPSAVHICLSPAMARELSARYRRNIEARIISNAAFVPAVPQPDRRPGSEIAIGLLSNLNREKGLHLFIEILRQARERNLPIHGVLAGPMGDEDKRFVETLAVELSGALDYRGAVYGDEKAAFFRDIDVFVFPTAYANEAQPTVVFEALGCAIPVISFDRGAIREQIGDAGLVIPQDGDFIGRCLEALDFYRADPARLIADRRAALSRYEEERRAGQAEIAALF